MNQNRLLKIAVGFGAIFLVLTLAIQALPMLIALAGNILYTGVMLIIGLLIIYGFAKLVKWILE